MVVPPNIFCDTPDRKWMGSEMSLGVKTPCALRSGAKDRILTSLSRSGNANRHREFDLERSELTEARRAMIKMMAEFEHCLAVAQSYDNRGYDVDDRIETSSTEKMAMVDTRIKDGRGSDVITVIQELTPSRHNCPEASKWLMDNYEEKEGISLPRSIMFSHYLEFCNGHSIDPMNQASFGKVVRAVFPNIRTRRLGTRGQSKYHYYGLTIKQTSLYKDFILNSQRVNNCFTLDGERSFHCRTLVQNSVPEIKHFQKTDGQSNVDVLLTDFPQMEDLQIKTRVKKLLQVFLDRYKQHCKHVLEAIFVANFQQVKIHITHFWNQLPSEITLDIHQEGVIDLICLCDVILYKAITTLLISSVLQPLPESLTSAVRSFSNNFVKWLIDALADKPLILHQRKIHVAKMFAKSMRRQTGICHMTSVAKNMLSSGDTLCKMVNDWQRLDTEVVIQECTVSLPIYPGDLRKYFGQFSRMLCQHVCCDRFLEWISAIVTDFVFSRKNSVDNYEDLVQAFILTWTFVNKIIMKELTLSNSAAIGSFHLLGMLFLDYILYLTEEKDIQCYQKKIENNVYTEVRNKKPTSTLNTPINVQHSSILLKIDKVARESENNCTGKLLYSGNKMDACQSTSKHTPVTATDGLKMLAQMYKGIKRETSSSPDEISPSLYMTHSHNNGVRKSFVTKVAASASPEMQRGITSKLVGGSTATSPWTNAKSLLHNEPKKTTCIYANDKGNVNVVDVSVRTNETTQKQELCVMFPRQQKAVEQDQMKHKDEVKTGSLEGDNSVETLDMGEVSTKWLPSKARSLLRCQTPTNCQTSTRCQTPTNCQTSTRCQTPTNCQTSTRCQTPGTRIYTNGYKCNVKEETMGTLSCYSNSKSPSDPVLTSGYTTPRPPGFAARSHGHSYGNTSFLKALTEDFDVNCTTDSPIDSSTWNGQHSGVMSPYCVSFMTKIEEFNKMVSPRFSNSLPNLTEKDSVNISSPLKANSQHNMASLDKSSFENPPETLLFSYQKSPEF